MKEKQANSTDIKWTLANHSLNAGQQANYKLSQLLPPDVAAHFATTQIGNQRYIWKWNVEATPLSKVPPEIVGEAYIALEALKQRVRNEVGNSPLTECFLKYPDDDFIMCYQDANGQTDVIITGWGFVSRKRVIVDVFRKYGFTMDKFQTIRVGFLIDGMVAPSRLFSLNNNGSINNLTTDDRGYYHFPKPFFVGTELTVTDLTTKKEFTFKVMKGQEEYLFELTTKAQITISVHKSGIPIAHTQVFIKTPDNQYSLTTDENGTCTQKVNYVENGQVTAKWDNLEETQQISPDGNNFIFEMPEQEIVEEPEIIEDSENILYANVKVIDQTGNPVPGYPITIEYAENEINFVADDYGIVPTPSITEGDMFTVKDTNNPNNYQQFYMSAQQGEYVLQVNIETPPATQNARIRIIDSNNNFVTNTAVTMTQQGMEPVEAYIDENGDCVVNKALFTPDAPIQLVVNDPNRQFPPIMFAMSIDEDDYLLSEENKTPWWLILLEVLIIIAVLVGLFFLCKPYIAGAFGISDLVH